MASNVGLLKVVLSADTAEFSRALDGAQGDIQSFADAAQKLGPVFQAAAAVAAGAAVAMVGSVQSAAIEINRLSQVAGASARDFQMYAFGAKDAGVEMDKFADILKDVQDKIGDFATTGGGPLKDFFETIGKEAGLTAESFRDLSGPQALQLFYTTLEKANVSQKDMVFWLEAIASDATLLQPLLRNNGAAFEEMGQRAAEFGAIIDDQAIAAAKDLNDSINTLQARASGFSTTIGSELLPVVAEVAREMADFGRENGVAEIAATALRTALEAIVLIGSDVVYVFKGVGREIGGIAAQAAALATLDFAGAAFIGEEMRRDAEAAAVALEEFQQRILNAGKASATAAGDIETLLPAVTVTASAIGAATPKIAKNSDAAKEASEAYKAFADAIKRAHDEAMAAAETDAELLRIAEEGLQSLQDQVRAQKEANEEIGIAGTALADLRARRLEDTAAQNEQTAATLASIPGNEQQVEAYRQKAEALRELAALTREGASQEALVQFADDFRQTADSINEYLSDAIFQAFQDGEGFAEGFKRTMESYFKRMVLQPLLAPISNGIASATTGGGGGGSGFGGFSSMLSGNQMGMTISNGMTSLAQTPMLAGTGAGNWLTGAAGNAAGVSNLSLGIAGVAGGFAGDLLFKGKGQAGTGGSIGATIGMAAAGPIGAVVGTVLGSALGSLVGGKPSNRSAGGSADLGTGQILELKEMTGDKAPDQATRDARLALLMSLASVGNSLGATGGIGVDVGGRDGIQIRYKNELKKYGSDVNAALREVYTQMLADTEGVDSEFREIIVSMLENAPAEIGDFLMQVSDNFSVLSTETERFTAFQTGLADQFASMGRAVPQTVDQFRALADSLDLTTEEGRSVYSQLVQIAPAFGELAMIVQTTFDSISRTTADAVREIETANLSNAAKYEYLDGEIEVLVGKIASATLPSEIESLFNQVNAKTLEAFKLLDTSEQQRLQTEFIDRLYEAEALAQARLSIAPIDEEGESVADAVARGLEGAAGRMAEAGESQQQAAAALAGAVAAIPGRIVVENRVTVAVPEVGYR